MLGAVAMLQLWALTLAALGIMAPHHGDRLRRVQGFLATLHWVQVVNQIYHW